MIYQFSRSNQWTDLINNNFSKTQLNSHDFAASKHWSHFCLSHAMQHFYFIRLSFQPVLKLRRSCFSLFYYILYLFNTLFYLRINETIESCSSALINTVPQIMHSHPALFTTADYSGGVGFHLELLCVYSPAILPCSHKQQAGRMSCWERETDLSSSLRTARIHPLRGLLVAEINVLEIHYFAGEQCSSVKGWTLKVRIVIKHCKCTPSYGDIFYFWTNYFSY